MKYAFASRTGNVEEIISSLGAGALTNLEEVKEEVKEETPPSTPVEEKKETKEVE